MVEVWNAAAKSHNGREHVMSTVSLVSPEALAFLGGADHVDLPGAEGDLGVLAGHAPIVTALRPCIVKVIANGHSERFVILGGGAESSRSNLNIPAETASPIAEFDIADLRSRIEKMEQIASTCVGEQLDREIQTLEHCRKLHQYTTVTTVL